jgi:PAS fold
MDLAWLVAEAILAAAADAVVATDRNGIIRVWNPGAERIFGHHADEALGQSLDLIIEWGDSQTGVVHRPCHPCLDCLTKPRDCAVARALGLFCATVPLQNCVQRGSPGCLNGPLVRQTVSTWPSSGNKPR